MEKVKINIVPKGLKPACYVSQNDNGRVVRFELFDELTPYTLDGSETITITVVRPDGVELVSSVVNTEDSYIDVVFNDDMTAIAGIADCELTITDGETVLGSRNFDMNIEIDAYNGKDVVIETATGVIASFNTEVEDNALEYESEIPYNAEGYTGLEIINSRTAPAYDKTPYLFRKTPSGYGNSCIEKLNGLTVAFNQLVINGNFETASNWGYTGAVLSVSNNIGSFTASSYRGNINNRVLIKNSHKLLFTTNIKLTTASNLIRIGILTQSGDTWAGYKFTESNTNWQTISGICVSNAIDNNNYFIIRDERSSDFDTIQVKNVMVIDLTQMFGSDLADHIYSLETAQVGAGVAYFRALFGADYYPFNAGELMSVKTSGRKTVGFNQYDEEWEVAGTGTASKNYIPVENGGTYYFKISTGWLTVTEYDANKNTIITYSVVNNTRTLSANCFYIKFVTSSAYGTTYNHDICINISDPALNGRYEPYNAVTYPLDPDLELRGIPKLDANNKLYADGDIYESNGDVTRRYGIVDLGSLDWTYNLDYDFFITTNDLDDIKSVSIANMPNLICPRFVTKAGYYVYTTGDGIGQENKKIRAMYSGAGTDAAAFKTSLDGVYLIYELATPTSESADPFTDPQEARITEEFIDNRAIPIPVGHDTIYGTDIEYQDIDFDTTIFGGDINAIDGVLTSRYNSDGSVKTTPDVIELDPALIPVKAGDNNIFNSASGAQTIRYYNQED